MKETIIDIILTLTLTFVFIAIFFLTYGIYVEKVIIEEQLDYIVKDIMNDLKLMGPEVMQSVKDSFKNIEAPNMDVQDKMVTDKNKLIYDEVMDISKMVLGVGIGLAIILMIVYKNEIDIKRILIGNFIIMLTIIITYFLFVNVIIRNYKPLDPNFVRKQMLIMINNYGKQLPNVNYKELQQDITKLLYQISKNPNLINIQQEISQETIQNIKKKTIQTIQNMK